jgi:hypothetical protein
MSVPAVFALQYVPGIFARSADPAAISSRLLSSELVFRLGMLSELAFAAGFVLVGLALDRLLREVDSGLATLMVALLFLSVPISFLNVLNEVAALTLAKAPPFLNAIDGPHRNALATLFLELHAAGFQIAQVFWGLWLLPLGVLVHRSGFLPRILGVLLVAAGLGYVALSVTALLLPSRLAAVSVVAAIPIAIGELPTILWLAIVGAREAVPQAP